MSDDCGAKWVAIAKFNEMCRLADERLHENTDLRAQIADATQHIHDLEHPEFPEIVRTFVDVVCSFNEEAALAGRKVVRWYGLMETRLEEKDRELAALREAGRVFVSEADGHYIAFEHRKAIKTFRAALAAAPAEESAVPNDITRAAVGLRANLSTADPAEDEKT